MVKKTDKSVYRLLGGSRQMQIRTGEDIKRIAALDPALWTMTGTQVSSMVGDPQFMEALDSDKNGRIRCDEVKAALNWMLSLLSGLGGVELGSDFLRIGDVNKDSAEGKDVLDTICIALDNLGLAGADGISLEQISDNEKIVSNALQNGDGVIPAEPVEASDTLAAECIRIIMNTVGSHKDVSGKDGINADDLTAFEKISADFLAWHKEYTAAAGLIQPFGDKTLPLQKALKVIEEKTDAFFRSSAVLGFGAGDLKLTTVGNTFDPLDPASVNAFLEKSPIANPTAGMSALPRSGNTVNPVWASQLEDFFAAYENAVGEKVSELSAAKWFALKKQLEAFTGWISRKLPVYDKLNAGQMQAFTDKKVYDYIRSLITNDLAVSDNLRNCKNVRKLILFQKYMMTFLNNFASLHDLLSCREKSMIQSGKLVMDGRIFTLCTPVPNPAEHKRIVAESDICVMYLDVTKNVPAPQSMKIAVAVTSGDMRNIFIGKSGVFFTDDGVVWDAKIFDLVRQPVSISEALKAPFYKFAEFFQKQTDKFFATRSKNYEDTLAKDIQDKADRVQTPGTPAPAQPAPPQGNAGSSGMMLMGGGIGLAALGSAFAFIVQSLQGISLGTVLAVILGIMLVFGGPIIAVALIKLFTRNLSRFFEANGYAINTKMRLSLKMGRIFTYEPKIPFGTVILPEKLEQLLQQCSPDEKTQMNHWLRLLLAVVVLAVLTAAAYYTYPWIRVAFDAVTDWLRF